MRTCLRWEKWLKAALLLLAKPHQICKCCPVSGEMLVSTVIFCARATSGRRRAGMLCLAAASQPGPLRSNIRPTAMWQKAGGNEHFLVEGSIPTMSFLHFWAQFYRSTLDMQCVSLVTKA